MSADKSQIVYTPDRRKPRPATASLLPVVQRFGAQAGIDAVTSDLRRRPYPGPVPGSAVGGAARAGTTSALGKPTLLPEANIIKLPNISASVPQLLAAIKELQGQGFTGPLITREENPNGRRKTSARATTNASARSAGEPCLREGNSDRRAPKTVKGIRPQEPAQHGEWSQASRSHVRTCTRRLLSRRKVHDPDRARNVKMELITRAARPSC